MKKMLRFNLQVLEIFIYICCCNKLKFMHDNFC